MGQSRFATNLPRALAFRPVQTLPHPAHRFCEAEGEQGAKTRTWFNVRERPIFAWAGMRKDSPEWGPVHSGLMTACNVIAREAIRNGG